MPFDANQIINVTARLAGAGLGVTNFGAALLLASDADKKVGAAAFDVNTYKEITAADDLLDYFEDTSEAYAAAQMFFSVTPRPLSLKVWLWDSVNDTVVESLALAEDATWFFWFDVTATQRADTASLLAIQTWAGAASKCFAATSNEANILDSAVVIDSVSEMVEAGIRYSFIEYHPTNKYAGLQTAALFARVNYSADNSTITAFGKRKPGLEAMDIKHSEYAALIDKGAVFYTKVEAGGETDDGRLLNPYSTSSFGETIEDIVDTEAFVNAMTVALYTYLVNATTKRPQTPQGQQGAIDAVGHVCEQFYRNGFLGARQYTDSETGETKLADHGYVILTKAEDVFLLSDADRAAHKLYPISVRAFRAGATFEISTVIDVE